MSKLSSSSTKSEVKAKVTLKVPEGAVYATGRRKTASARVWIFRGTGKFVVNAREIQDYFARDVARMMINQPFAVTNNMNKFDVFCTVKGSGLTGQAQAIRHGVSRALIEHDDTFKSELKSHGLTTRDSRVVERKKYGKKKARKSFQFSKR